MNSLIVYSLKKGKLARFYNNPSNKSIYRSYPSKITKSSKDERQIRKNLRQLQIHIDLSQVDF